MKFKSLALFALLLSVSIVVVENAQAYKRAYQTFEFTGTNPLNPTHYIAASVPSCSGDGAMCGLDIPDADVYTQTEVNTLGKPQAYVGKPKADLLGSGQLGAQIQTSVPAAGETDVTRVNDRLIIEKF